MLVGRQSFAGCGVVYWLYNVYMQHVQFVPPVVVVNGLFEGSLLIMVLPYSGK